MASRSLRRPPARRLAEFPLIEDLARRFGGTGRDVVRGIGDDAAVLRGPSGDLWLLTTDLLAEGVHFDRATATFEDIGYKAAVANLSDIAAMGGVPRYLLVSLAIPAGRTQDEIRRLYRGMMSACRPYRVELIGGDTSSSRGGLFINVTLTGTVTTGRALTRSGARVGDLLYVTGTLGDSLAGLQLLAEARGTARAGNGLRKEVRHDLVQRHLRPTPRLAIGQLLAQRKLATSAIDLSDGLSGDLAHICTQSRVGAELDLLALPLSPACLDYAEARRKDPFQLALAGGEDYELLVTVPPGNRTQVERLARSLGCRLSRIGRIQSPRLGLTVIGPDGSSHALAITGYRHFEARPQGH